MIVTELDHCSLIWYIFAQFFPANLQRVTRGFKFNALQFNADKLVTDTLYFLDNYMTPSNRFPDLKRYK